MSDGSHPIGIGTRLIMRWAPRLVQTTVNPVVLGTAEVHDRARECPEGRKPLLTPFPFPREPFGPIGVPPLEQKRHQ
jgi:hypothetical protein